MLDRVQLAFSTSYNGDGYVNLVLAMIAQAATDLRTRAGLSAAVWLLSEDFDVFATCLKMDANQLKYDIFHHQFFEKAESCEMVRIFKLFRYQDMSGVSGTGVVAEGILFKTGKTVICWSRSPYSVTVFDSIEEMLQVHGHHGKTEVRWQEKSLQDHMEHTANPVVPGKCKPKPISFPIPLHRCFSENTNKRIDYDTK